MLRGVAARGLGVRRPDREPGGRGQAARACASIAAVLLAIPLYSSCVGRRRRRSATSASALRVAWLFARPAGRVPRPARRGRDPHVVADHLAHARGRRPAADRAAIRGGGSEPAGSSRSRSCSSASTCSARAWASTRRSTGITRASPRPRRSASSSAKPARFVSTEEIPLNVLPFASASTRRAATTCRSCSATTGSGAAR